MRLSNQRSTMSTKTSSSERITTPSKKTGKPPQTLKAHDTIHKRVTASPTKEVLLISKGDIVCELTVKKEEKTKSQKRIISSPGQKAERKRSATGNSEMIRNWGSILTEQKLLYMKAQSSKHSESKETNKNLNSKKVEYNHVQKHSGTISSKGTASREKSEKDSKYVYVQDRAVQCPEICNNANRFVEFNPVRTLSFLMKELKDLVMKKDDRTCEIFTQMEQVLFRIPVSPSKPVSEDLEKLGTLEAGALQLKESSKKVKALYESWASEREKLKSLIREQDAQIKEANQKQEEIVLHTEILTQKIEEATCVIKTKDDIISALKRQIENDERKISDLKAELIKQTELKEYLIMDKDKLSKLSSYQDTLIVEYQNTIMKLQNQIEKLKLKNLNVVFAKEESISSQISAIQTGLAYSSPTSSFSGHSNKSWHDLSDISTVEHASQGHVIQQEDVPVRDSARLEFVSLLDGESSHTIMPDQSQVKNDKETIVRNNNKSNIVPCRNVNDVTPKRCLHYSSKKGHNKENDVCKMRKFSRFKERQKENTKSTFCHNTSKILESVTSTKPLVSDIRKQGHDRLPVNVPSPLRDFPRPDWSDSSLPSVSTASNLDMVPSNDI